MEASFSSGQIRSSTRTLHTVRKKKKHPTGYSLSWWFPQCSLWVWRLWYSTRALMNICLGRLRHKRADARALPESDQNVGRCQGEFFRIKCYSCDFRFVHIVPQNPLVIVPKQHIYCHSAAILLPKSNHPFNQWIPDCSIDISYHFMCGRTWPHNNSSWKWKGN